MAAFDPCNALASSNSALNLSSAIFPLRSFLAPFRFRCRHDSLQPAQRRLSEISSYRGERRPASSKKTLSFRVRAEGVEAAVQQEQEPASANAFLKQFLEELKSVGRVRIIVNTGVGILESVTSLEKLFYHSMPGRGEYANLMNKEENVDFHLLIDKVTAAKLVKGKSMRGDIPTYMVRFNEEDDKTAASLLVMWKPGTNGEYDPGQVEAFEHLLQKYGKEAKFKK